MGGGSSPRTPSRVSPHPADFAAVAYARFTVSSGDLDATLSSGYHSTDLGPSMSVQASASLTTQDNSPAATVIGRPVG
jgi:hypothetical protein